MNKGLTHLNSTGEASMVDVSAKPDSVRIAVAQSIVELTPSILISINDNAVPKGDLFAVARVAGIQAAKKTSDLIPLCHHLALNKVSVDFTLQDNMLLIQVMCTTTAKTGVEMEALTGASIAALTIYDMCKGIDKGIIIRRTRLLSKTGGKSGAWQADD